MRERERERERGEMREREREREREDRDRDRDRETERDTVRKREMCAPVSLRKGPGLLRGCGAISNQFYGYYDELALQKRMDAGINPRRLKTLAS